MVHLKAHFGNKVVLKIVALVVGYFLWLNFSKYQRIKAKIQLPVFFYNQPSHKKIEVEDKVYVDIYGPRKYIFSKYNSVHVNLDQINLDGEYEFKVAPESIFLNPYIYLKDYYPEKIKVKVIEENEKK